MKLPWPAALLVYASRAALGIGVGATLVLLVYVFAKLSGHPITDTGLGDAALAVGVLSLALWFACVVVAIIADRMRDL